MIEIVLIVVVIMASACDIVWIPNHEGLFSQFLQLRVIVRVVADFNATSFCTAPVLTVHFNNTPTSSCDVFHLESSGWTCLARKVDTLRTSKPVFDVIRCANQRPHYALRKSHYKSHNLTALRGTILSGTLPFMGGETRRDAMLRATSFTRPRLNVIRSNGAAYAAIRAALGRSYTVVHWRRGDQLPTRCRQQKDNSLNCGTVADLVQTVRKGTNDSVVYVAAGGTLAPIETDALDKANFLHLAKLNMRSDPAGAAALALEAQLMLDAPTFLAWGVSIMNDVIEHERMLQNKTWCSTKEYDVPYPTWCWLQHQRITRYRQRNPRAVYLSDRAILLLEDRRMQHAPLILSQYDISGMPVYLEELARERSRQIQCNVPQVP
jgi:hypothetical protein